MDVNGTVFLKVDAIEDMHRGQWWTLMILCSLKWMLLKICTGVKGGR